MLLKLWSLTCAPITLPPHAKFPRPQSSSTELAQGLIKGELKPSGCGPSLPCPFTDVREGGAAESLSLENTDTLPGCVATVVCSH